MTRWAMSIDLDVCTACGACVVACSQENNVPPGDPTDHADRLIRWMEILPEEHGEYPHVGARMLPMPCQHCDRPPCTKVCPVYATFRDSEGLVPQIYPRCIGCRYCVNACPFTCKYFNWSDPVWPEPMDRALNPDVSVRTRGVTEKCNFCLHRLQEARDRAARDGRPFHAADFRTACQDACPTHAIQFGNVDNHNGALAAAEHDPRAEHLLEDLGVETKVIYLKVKP